MIRGGSRGNLMVMNRPATPSRPVPAGMATPPGVTPGPVQTVPSGLDALLPSGRETLRRLGGLGLLICSLWLVAVLAFVRSIIGLFT